MATAIAASLRFIGDLGSSSFLRLRRAPAVAFFAELLLAAQAQARLQVVEDEAGRGSRPVTAATSRSPSVTTKTQPSWKATSTCVGSPAGPAALQELARLLGDRAGPRVVADVEASTMPSPSASTANSICDEISTRSASACAASTAANPNTRP